ncbi:hypothetical protein D046_8421A, partial [Vibrio parahaemolyticus V-223/04]
MAAPSRRGSA